MKYLISEENRLVSNLNRGRELDKLSTLGGILCWKQTGPAEGFTRNHGPAGETDDDQQAETSGAH